MNLKTELYNHQLKAVDKLSALKVGALFMDMGTGKTRTILQIIHDKKDKWDRVFYFCPCSIRQSIKNEIEKHSDIDCQIVYKSPIKSLSTIMIIGLETISNSDFIYLDILNLISSESFIIIDESILIKNHKAKRTKRLIEIGNKAKYRFIMCGTPMSQGLVDLYSQFKFLSPKILGYNSFHQFEKFHIGYSNKYPGKINRYYNEKIIAKKINPYIYQITKDECLDLPRKRFYNEYFDMTYNQNGIYRIVYDQLLGEIDYNDFRSYTLFKLFTCLQQVSCGVTPKRFHQYNIDNPRLELLKDILERVLYPVVIFCKYKQDIVNISKLVDCVLFYGKMNHHEKKESVDSFLNGKSKVFVATQQSGAYGLNLQIAKTCIFYNNQFSYEIRRQSEDRIHRIGMDSSGVNYIDIICNNSIDELIHKCLSRKENIIFTFKEEIDKIKDKKEKEKYLKELIINGKSLS